MTQFEDRKNRFEKEYAHNAEMMFKAEARACKLFGMWLSSEIGLAEAESKAYAADIVAANMEEPGFNDVVRFVMPAVEDKSLGYSESDLLAKLEAFFDEAKVQLMSEGDGDA